MAANRRPIALAAAVATAAALGATFALPALAADSGAATGTAAAAATRLELKDGTLDWGFKQSFRSYIGAAGKITVSNGAEQAANNGAFTFVHGKEATTSPPTAPTPPSRAASTSGPTKASSTSRSPTSRSPPPGPAARSPPT